ncbi:hypothetical protein [Burkholderia glumae]|uniref:hypothetical protein n=1 Tax=Burkholderia glumae TaxID=337 RepID=UPI00214FBDE1|nr:hypothetical protein [Burkholderia glumae]
MTTTNESSTDNRFYRETTTRPADGGPVFPSCLTAKEVKFANGRVEGAYVAEFASSATGLSLRDYFAARALHCALLNGQGNWLNADVIASSAYALAAAMLKARG